MRIYVRAVGSGKEIEVLDKNDGNKPKFNQHVAVDQQSEVSVASYDSITSLVDINKRHPTAAWVSHVTDYVVGVNETVDVDDSGLPDQDEKNRGRPLDKLRRGKTVDEAS